MLPRTLRRCGGCGQRARCVYVAPLALHVCPDCHRKWDAAHVAINADPEAKARRMRHHGDAGYADHEYRQWWREDSRTKRR